MLDIQKIIDKITRIKKLKIKTFEIIFDELDEVISELLDIKEEIELKYLKALKTILSHDEKANDYSESDSDSDYSFNSNDIKALRHYVKHLKE